MVISGTGVLPLSFGQERLWFLDQLLAMRALYNSPLALHLRGPVDIGCLERALSTVSERHSVLCARFSTVDGTPMQALEGPAPQLEVRKLAGSVGDLGHALKAELARPIDLEIGPPARLVFWDGAGEGVLLAVAHHIVWDAWSADVFRRELQTLYAAFRAGQPSPLPPLPARYADFVEWQRAWARSAACDDQLRYWRTQLRGAPLSLELPADRPRPATPTYSGQRERIRLDDAAVAGMRRLAREERATPFMVLLAAFGLLLHRYTGQDDLLIGSPMANRRRPEFHDLIGFFLNTLALRVDLRGRPTFRELVRRVRRTALEAYAHQDLPFERLVQQLPVQRDPRVTPVVQAAFVYAETSSRVERWGTEVEAEVIHVQPDSARFDLTLDVAMSEPPRAELDYADELFSATRMRAMADELGGIFATGAEDPDASVARKATTTVPAPARESATDTIIQRFRRTAERMPDAVAVRERGALTYAQLDALSDVLAARLSERGAGPESIVGLLTGRGLGQVVGVVGILKAGAAYLPLDPDYPADRLSFMAADAGAGLLVADRESRAKWSGIDVTFVELPTTPEPTAVPPALSVVPANLAYVIYTSGSTGTPKGVAVTHQNVTRLFDVARHKIPFGDGDVWTLFHSLSFDFSVWEIWGALLHGGTLVIVPRDVARSPDDFCALLARERVTVLSQTPSAFRQLAGVTELDRYRSELRVRLVVLGGEAMDRGAVARWWERTGRGTDVVNMYGITETTVHVTWKVLNDQDLEPALGTPIGEPLPDLRVHVLGPDLEVRPTGAWGEAFVAGPGVARGYLGRPRLTASRFVPDPGGHGTRMYRSGDAARQTFDGLLEHAGRVDRQVKVRGYRIELGEIESVLKDHPEVQDAIVALGDGRTSHPQLAAFVVSRAASRPSELRDFVRSRLPEHMLPTSFTFVDSFPLTENGKVDLSALRDKVQPPSAAPTRGTTWVEDEVRQAWVEVLGHEGLASEQDFFESGGHSLAAVRVIARIRERLQVHVPVRWIFEAPRLGDLARRVEAAMAEQPGVAGTPL